VTSGLQFRRESDHYRDRLRAYVIFVDGERVGQVRRGEVVSIDVAPGTREIDFRLDWGRSESLRVDVPDNQVVRFRCRPNVSQSALAAITTGRKRYIVLERDD
jgi:hypothetical protein